MDYNELAQYVGLWATCEGCEELVSADDLEVQESVALCWNCRQDDCPHGREFRSECPLCAAGVPGKISERVAEELLKKKSELPTMGDVAEFLRDQPQD